VWIFQSEREKSAFLKGTMLNRQGFPEIREIKNIKTKGYYSAEDDLNKDAMFQVVILSSKNKLALQMLFSGECLPNTPLRNTSVLRQACTVMLLISR